MIMIEKQQEDYVAFEVEAQVEGELLAVVVGVVKAQVQEKLLTVVQVELNAALAVAMYGSFDYDIVLLAK